MSDPFALLRSLTKDSNICSTAARKDYHANSVVSNRPITASLRVPINHEHGPSVRA
jgi:hypothetical protein